MAPQGTRTVLGRNVTRDQLDDAFFEGGYRLVNVIDPAPGRPAQLVFARHASCFVHVVDDRQLGVTYLAAQGDDSTTAIAELQRALPCDTAASAREPRGPELASQARALAVLVLLDPDAPDLEQRIEQALKAEQPQLRSAGLTAAAYAPRARLRGIIETLRIGDPEPQLREMAARVLDAFDGGGSP